jgi:hypothetical protein
VFAEVALSENNGENTDVEDEDGRDVVCVVDAVKVAGIPGMSGLERKDY